MAMKLLRLMFRNLKLKVLGVLLASLLWLHVATNHTYNLDVNYSLYYADLADSLALAAPPPAETTVRMRGTGKALIRLLWQDRRWPIDLSHASAGSIEVKTPTDQVPLFGLQGLEVLGFNNPGYLHLVVDSVDRKTVPVVNATIFHAAAGHVRVGPPQLAPDSVRLTGPRRELAGIEAVRTRSTVFTDVSQSIQSAVDLIPPPGYRVEMTPRQTLLFQRVEPLDRQTFASIPVRVMPMNPGDSLAAVPGAVAVEISGPRSAMAVVAAESITVRYIPAADDTSGARRPIQAVVHPPLEVLKVTPDSITVRQYGRARTHPRHRDILR